eukprot:9472154-Pyramimonas_sp.AAC.1
MHPTASRLRSKGALRYLGGDNFRGVGALANGHGGRVVAIAAVLEVPLGEGRGDGAVVAPLGPRARGARAVAPAARAAHGLLRVGRDGRLGLRGGLGLHFPHLVVRGALGVVLDLVVDGEPGVAGEVGDVHVALHAALLLVNLFDDHVGEGFAGVLVLLHRAQDVTVGVLGGLAHGVHLRRGPRRVRVGDRCQAAGEWAPPGCANAGLIGPVRWNVDTYASVLIWSVYCERDELQHKRGWLPVDMPRFWWPVSYTHLTLPTILLV